uniref:T-cell receptor alpha/delta variable 40.0 n=1 Tax=Sinocyclocheilus grahami TaxID=75366 RepID=A0A672Q6V6_SINGR
MCNRLCRYNVPQGSSLILCLMFPDVTAVNKIEPNKGTRIIKTEGESVTLSCSYDSDSENVRLYWYRQYPNGEPQYLLREGARSNSAKHSSDPRFQSSTSRMLTELISSSVTVSDSALYYCASII